MSDDETLYQTRWLSLHRRGHWDFVRRPDSDHAVGILAITPEREIILVEQFRVPIQSRTIEVPAGIVGDEEEHRGEPLEETARRELWEETGYRARTITELISSPTSSGLTAEFIHLFHATGLVREHDGGGVENEDITVHHVPLETLDTWLAEKRAQGLAVDFKIHAALRLAGL